MGLGHKPQLYISVVDGGKHDIHFSVSCCGILLYVGKVCWSWWSSSWYWSRYRSFASTCCSGAFDEWKLTNRIMISKFPILRSICSVWTIVEKECPNLTRLWRFVLTEVKWVIVLDWGMRLEDEPSGYEDELLKDQDVWIWVNEWTVDC